MTSITTLGKLGTMGGSICLDPLGGSGEEWFIRSQNTSKIVPICVYIYIFKYDIDRSAHQKN